MGARFNYAELNDKQRAMVDSGTVMEKAKVIQVPVMPQVVFKESKRKMTKTESQYMEILQRTYGAANVFFEAVRLRMKNNHWYKPDFVVRRVGEPLLMVEVKGSYRLQSYGRARLAFDQARIDWPDFSFRWCEKTKDGEWICKP